MQELRTLSLNTKEKSFNFCGLTLVQAVETRRKCHVRDKLGVRNIMESYHFTLRTGRTKRRLTSPQST